MNIIGSIPSIILNEAGLYHGRSLQPYYKAVCEARNVCNPYHNFRHMLHVTWLCYRALEYYKTSRKISLLQGRILLIAALFHDYNHPGRSGNDDLNIETAIRGLRANIQKEDRDALPQIEELISYTEYPHKGRSEDLPLLGQIIRDADVSQVFSDSWIQPIIFGLATEMGKSSKEMFQMQSGFIGSLHYTSEWARAEFPPEVITAKLEEIEKLEKLVA